MNSISPVKSRSVIETALALLLLFILLFDLYAVLRVFFGVFTYAIIFSVSFAKLFEKLVRLLNNKRKLAAFIYGLLLVAIIVVAIHLYHICIGRLFDKRKAMDERRTDHGIPPLPAWIVATPLVGGKVQCHMATITGKSPGGDCFIWPSNQGILNRLDIRRCRFIRGRAGVYLRQSLFLRFYS
jgi:hypothetical protein